MSESEKTGARFVNEAGRTERIDLSWPVEFDGKVYDHIIARRMTAGEVASFVAEVQAMPPEERDRARWPIFQAPTEVLEMLDVEDDDKLGEVVDRFLPRRFRGEASK